MSPGPRDLLQVFDARCSLRDHFELLDLVGDATHAGFVQGLLGESVRVFERDFSDGGDDQASGIERKRLELLLRNPSGTHCVVQLRENPIVARAVGAA